MITVSLTLKGADPFIAALKKHPQRISRTIESVLKQEARSLCVELGAATAPVGMTESRANKLRGRIESDIKRLFPTTENQWQVYEMIKKSNEKLALAYGHSVKSGDDEAVVRILRRAKLPRGIDKGGHQAARKSGKVPGNAQPLALVTAGRRTAYVRQRMRKAGLAKAGWYKAARALGGRVRTRSRSTGKSIERFPKYVRALAKTSGIGGASFTGGVRARARIWNTVTYIGSALPEDRYNVAVSNAQSSFVHALNESVIRTNQRSFSRRPQAA